jgi:hypothetical protein
LASLVIGMPSMTSRPSRCPAQTRSGLAAPAARSERVSIGRLRPDGRSASRNARAQADGVRSGGCQCVGRVARTRQQAEQQVLGADVGLPRASGLDLGPLDGRSRVRMKSLEHQLAPFTPPGGRQEVSRDGQQQALGVCKASPVVATLQGRREGQGPGLLSPLNGGARSV